MSNCEKSEVKTKTMGYIQHFNWLEYVSKRYEQHKCKECNKYHIIYGKNIRNWRRKCNGNSNNKWCNGDRHGSRDR